MNKRLKAYRQRVEETRAHGLTCRRSLRFKELYDKGGELALQEISRKKPLALEQPAFGQVRNNGVLDLLRHPILEHRAD
jgi:hypothetical protein